MGRESQYHFVKILILGSKTAKIHVLLNVCPVIFKTFLRNLHFSYAFRKACLKGNVLCICFLCLCYDGSQVERVYSVSICVSCELNHSQIILDIIQVVLSLSNDKDWKGPCF